MKKLILSITTLVTFLIVGNVNAQSTKIAVINFDTRGLILSPVDMGRMASLELEKTNKFEVMDKYDILYITEQKGLELENCYGKTCASIVGKTLEVDKVLTGSVERFNEKITYSLRLIDVESKSIEKTAVFEFVNLQPHLQQMTKIMIDKLLNLPLDDQKVKELEYLKEPIINNTSRLSAKGPRMGVAYITKGATADYLKKYDKYPVLTQFGYQHEVQYLTTGNFQALFEIVGLVSGMDQGLFIPSVSLMNGFRNTKNGLEFAFGPVFGIKEDVKGNIKFTTNFAYAIGKTFKSGHLNIPINIYVAPDKKDGWHIGASFGFNINKSNF